MELLDNISSFLPADIQKIGQIANSSIIFRLHNNSNIKYLYFAPVSDIKAVAFSNESPQRDYKNADWLGPHIHNLLNSKLVKIEKINNIFSLSFDNNFTCDIHFFSGTGNAILIDENKKIAAAMHPGKFFAAGNEYNFSKNVKHVDVKINVLDKNSLIEKLNLLEFQNLKKSISHTLNSQKKKLIKRLNKINAELDDTNHIEEYKLKGELLKANYHLLKRGMSAVTLVNYFSPENEKIEIKLEPIKKPQENIAKYFKKAKKLQRGKNKILQRIEITNAEIESINKKCRLLSTISDVGELNKLFPINKYQSAKNVARNQQIHAKTKKITGKSSNIKIKHFISSDNFDILVGNNAKENDYLTVKLANGNDMWMHTKNKPGAHVVIRAQRGKNFPKQTLIEAAKLCARFSKTKDGALEDISYTLKKNVNKTKGMKPGAVLVAATKTITIQYNEREVKNWMSEQSNR